MNVDVFIPIRLDSARLANKHLLKINGKPLLKYLIERLKKSKKIRNIIVCTTNTKHDDLLIEFLKIEGVTYFRGDKNNILI